MKEIKIQGGRIHNLKNVNLTIPKNQLVVITGISGSGKSSLAFDILFEEGKNQYLNSIGILAGLDNHDRFHKIEGIGPTVAVRQNTIRQSNPRSTVGTKTGILNQLALVYACDGTSLVEGEEHLSAGTFLYTTADGMCLNCEGRGYYYDINLEQLIPDKVTTLLDVYKGMQVSKGFMRLLKKKYGSYFETPFWGLPEDIQGEVIYGTYDNGKQSYCLERIFRNAYVKGEDVEAFYTKSVCPTCQGKRVSAAARGVVLGGRQIGELGQMTISDLSYFLDNISEEGLSQFSNNIINKLREKIKHLSEFSLGHLSLYREMSTLSGGEVQRVFLHLHLESKLDSLIYVLDEPMAGLHPAEKQPMISVIKKLRDYGNTVVVVEHDPNMIRHADQIIEIGPKAGREGGSVVYQGGYEDYKKVDTLLSQLIMGKALMSSRRTKTFLVNKNKFLKLEHATTHYLKDLTVEFPLHVMVGIAGLSGSGKSSLIEETLLKRLASVKKYGQVTGIKGIENISGFIKISQKPIGRSINSTPASYVGIWDKIRDLFAKQPEGIKRNMSPGHFSFNSKGACEQCGGNGYDRIFLTPDFSVDKLCTSCQGKRFNQETLAITYKGSNIADVLDMSISEALHFFNLEKTIIKPLSVLEQMGMGYLTLGQPSSSLSGGEAQRVKLAKELGRDTKGNMLYVLDEPTAGLSLYDTALLLKLLDNLVASGNSVIIIEHDVTVLKSCDYIIELGPEGGDKGGNIIAMGSPEELKSNTNSKTGKYLA